MSVEVCHHVNVILGEAEDKGLRGSINLVGGVKISFDFNGIWY